MVAKQEWQIVRVGLGMVGAETEGERVYQVVLEIPFSVQGGEVVMVVAVVRNRLKFWKVFAAPRRNKTEGVWAWQVRWGEVASCWVELRRVLMRREVFDEG